MDEIVLQERFPPLPRLISPLAIAGMLTLWAATGGSARAEAAVGQPQKLPTIQLSAGMHLIKAEVAQTPQEQATGLMWRTEMGANDGMLFIFPKAGVQCFWMKNTLIPLSIAFLDDQGEIVNIDDMKPRSEASHCSAKPVRHVLEMNAGWFQKRGLKSGSKIKGAPFNKAP
jgi:uncharacterized protein